MKFALLLILTTCCYCYLNSTVKLDVENVDNDYSDQELELVRDIIENLDSRRNIIFLTSNMDGDCLGFGCERYTAVDLENGLRRRGKLHDMAEEDPQEPYQSLEERRIKNAGSSKDDLFIMKIKSFKSNEVKLLNVIKEYNPKSYIIMIIPDDVLVHLKEHVESTGMFNVYLIMKAINDQMYFLYNLCAFCNAGEHRLQQFNRWIHGKGFWKQFQLVDSFRGKFNGGGLKLALKLNGPPFIFITGFAEDGLPIYSGITYWVMEYLAESMDFKIVSLPTDNAPCFVHDTKKIKQQDVILSGVCKSAVNEEAEITNGMIDYRMAHYFEAFGVTDIIFNRLVSAQPKKELKVGIKFKSTFIIAIMITYFTFICVLFMIEGFQGTRNFDEYTWIMFELLSVICKEAVRFRNLGGLRHLLMAVWMIACFFAITDILGELTSISTAGEPLQPYIDSLENMKQRNISWIESTWK